MNSHSVEETERKTQLPCVIQITASKQPLNKLMAKQLFCKLVEGSSLSIWKIWF